MPEDQGINGDRWTTESSLLLRSLGWKKIADSNIDIQGSDGLMHGIDALFSYEDGFQPKKEQGVFLEAKRYKTSSFSPSKLPDWIKRFDEKIRELKMSEHFYEQYPRMRETNPSNGLLAIWFHDLENYSNFVPKFNESLKSVQTPRRRGGSSTVNRLFVLENEGILKLSSLINTIKNWNEKQGIEKFDTSLKFVYPSSLGFGYPIQEIPVLNLEFIYSKFILARAREFTGNSLRVADIVFYFGALDIDGFYRLKQALLLFNMINSANSLYIYFYRRDDEFRKIQPDVEFIFKEKGPSELRFRTMEILGDLPAWVKDKSME